MRRSKAERQQQTDCRAPTNTYQAGGGKGKQNKGENQKKDVKHNKMKKQYQKKRKKGVEDDA